MAAMAPLLEAAVVILALRILEKLGFATDGDVSGRKVVERLQVSRSRTFEIADGLPALLCAPLAPSDPCAGHIEELRRLRIRTEVLEYRLAHPGSWCPGGRTTYNDAAEAFILDLARKHGVGTDMTQADFAAACGIPLSTLKDWWGEERSRKRIQLEMFPKPIPPPSSIVETGSPEPRGDVPDLGGETSSSPAGPGPAEPPPETAPPTEATAPSPGGAPTQEPAPTVEESVRVSFSLDMVELIRKYDAWEGTFNAFYRELRRGGLRRGKDWVRGVLYLAAARKLLGRPPPQPPGRGSTFRPFPGLQWSSDGKEVKVIVDGETFTLNWQPTVDIGSCAIVGTATRAEEDTAGVIESFQDGAVDTTGTAPAFLLLDNKSCNTSKALEEALPVGPDGTEIMHSTLGRATNKAHVEGNFGNFAQDLGPVIATVETSSRERTAETVAAAVTRAYSIGRNRRARRSDGKTPYDLYLESHPSPKDVDTCIEQLRAIKDRDEIRNEIERARRDPRVAAALAQACQRFGFVEDGDILASVYGYRLEIVQQAIAIYAAKEAAASLPVFADRDGALRYFAGIARHCLRDLELQHLEDTLVAQIEGTGATTLQHLEQEAAKYEPLEIGPRVVKVVDHLIKTSDFPLGHVFWRRRLLAIAATVPPELRPALRRMLCARVRRCYDLSHARAQKLVLLLVGAFTPQDPEPETASRSAPL
jgi:hypothetical protein